MNKTEEIKNVYVDELLKDESPHVSMKDIDLEDRPREKLMELGAERLSNAELFATLIGSGTREQNATELMQQILNDCGGMISLLDRMEIDELMTYKGIAEAKAIKIKAALELSNRRMRENMSDLRCYSTAESVYQFMKPRIQSLSHEECWAMMLNNNARLLRVVQLSQGGLNTTIVDTRILCKKAIIAEAMNVILIHHHQSGSLRPSRDDDILTQRVKTALSTLDIRLIDHIIVTDGGYYSYNEMGRL